MGRDAPDAGARAFVVAELGVVGLVVAFRVATLWSLPPYFDESLYAVQSFAVATDPTARFVALTDGKGPLFTWLAAVPVTLGIAPLTAVRLVAAIASAATVALVGALGRRAGGSLVGLVAAIVYAVLPLVVVQGAMGFYEPLLGCFAAAALVVQWDLAERPTVRRGLLLGLALAAGLLTKPTAQIVVVLLPLMLVLRRRPGTLGPVVAALAVAGFAQAIMMASARVSDAPHVLQYTPPGFALRHAATILPASWPGHRAVLAAHLTMPVVLAIGVGVGAGLVARTRATAFLVAWTVAAVVATTLVAGKPLARYHLPWLAPPVVLCALGLVSVARDVRRRLGVSQGLVVAVVTVAALVPALWFDWSFAHAPRRTTLPGYDNRELNADWPAGWGLDRLAARIAERAHGDEVIAFMPPGTVNAAFSLLLDDPGQQRFVLVGATDARAADARFVVEAAMPTVQPLPCIDDPGGGCRRLDPARYRLLDAVGRPWQGATIRLFERIE